MSATSATSSFGSLGPVPFLSLHEIKATTNTTQYPQEYAYVISGNQLSIQRIGDTPLKGETSLAKITQFVREHLAELPTGSRFLVPKQINFLVKEYNEQHPEAPIEELPGYEYDLSYAEVLDRLRDPIATFTASAPDRADAFFTALDANLALFPTIESAVDHTIYRSHFSSAQKRTLIEAVESVQELAFRKIRQVISQVFSPTIEGYYHLAFAFPIEQEELY